MQHPGFFERAGPFTLDVMAAKLGVSVGQSVNLAKEIWDVKPLHQAGRRDVSFFDNAKYLGELSSTQAGACLVAPAVAERLPRHTTALVTKTPYIAFAYALQLFYGNALQTAEAKSTNSSGKGSWVHETARIGENAIIEPGAVVGREAQIGRGTVVAAGAVVGYRVAIGQDSFVGPSASISHAIVGDRVIVHAGVRIGQDGFGFAMGPNGHLKVPQVGRVIVDDDVEIGANSTIDRGAMSDTIIGQGTKIDNLVQIGHNVIIGRHCVIVAQSGVAGSAQLGDHVVMGGQSGVVGHVTVGCGAQIAGSSHVTANVPPGARMGGTPAVPFNQWARGVAAIKRLSVRRSK